MARTTDAMVIEVLRGDYDTLRNPSLTRYISAANLITSRVAVCAAAKNPTLPLTDEELLEIETWLAAHYYASASSESRPLQESSTLSSKAKFQGMTGKSLESTYYGQAALNLDPTGCLTALSKGNRGRLVWLGLRPSEQTDVEDRR